MNTNNNEQQNNVTASDHRPARARLANIHITTYTNKYINTMCIYIYIYTHKPLHAQTRPPILVLFFLFGRSDPTRAAASSRGVNNSFAQSGGREDSPNRRAGIVTEHNMLGTGG